MGLSRLVGIKIPTVIPKRNKGHHEVMCECTVEVDEGHLKDITMSIEYLTSLIKNTCSVHTPLELATNIYKKERLSTLRLDLNFLYHLDRASASYKSSFYEMPCFYKVQLMENQRSFEMGVVIPVRVKEALSVAGQLVFSVFTPKEIYFEDILDYAQKKTGIKLYPTVCFEDKEKLSFMLDEGMTVTEYISALSDTKELNRLGEKIKLQIRYPNVYNTYEEHYETVVVETKGV